MGRYLAIDYGKKRCGIAITDPLRIIATALDTVPSHELMNYLSAYLKKEPVDVVVLGKPLGEGSSAETLLLVQRFASAFSKRFPGVNIAWIDERFTSRMASRAMVEGGMKKKERRKKENIDKISAVIILQSYLEQENNPGV